MSRKCIHWSSLLIKLQEYSLQTTTGLKTILLILSYKCSERKGYSKILKIPKLFFLVIRNGKHSHSHEKLWFGFKSVFWKSWKFARKNVHIKVTVRTYPLLKRITSYIFQGMFIKTVVLQVSENSQKDVFSRVPF